MSDDARSRFVEAMRRFWTGHYSCDGDSWYSCPLSTDGCVDESATECICSQAEREAAKRAAVEAFADAICGSGADQATCPLATDGTPEEHAACRAALVKEVFGE